MIRARGYKSIYWMMTPFFIIFAVFTLFPVLFSICMSFADFNALQPARFIGLKNYQRIFLEDPIFKQAFQHTLLLAFTVGPIGYMLSFVLAWILNEFSVLTRTIFTVILYGPSLAGNAYMIWGLIFSSDSNGYANAWLMSLGLIQEPILWLKDPKYMMLLVMLVQIWMSFGIGFLSFIAGLQGLDRAQLEAGELDGIRNRWQELWYIVLPSMRPQLLFGAVMSIASSFSITGSALTGFPSTGYATHTLIDHINDYGLTRLELGYSAALAVILFILMLLMTGLIRRFLAKVGR
ncbi:MAG: sugar ABC transporter permease [Eubacteriales bacterium]|nr:sugar ABC transporter permease [Eubacteriales bacterium]